MSCIPINDFSLISLCDATKAGKLYSIVPADGSGDFTVARNSTATYVGADGLIKTAAIDEPRIEFNVDGSYKGLLVEPQRTNLFLRSEEFDNSYWAKGNTTVTANATTAPDGSLTADKLFATTTGTDRRIQRAETLAAGTYTNSIFVKSAELSIIRMYAVNFSSQATFNLSAGTVGSIIGGAIAKIENYGNGWYRCSLTVNFAGGSTQSLYLNIGNALGGATITAGDGVFIWGAQLEAASTASSYIPTVASTVTRVPDVVTKTGASALIGQTEGTLYGEFTAKSFETTFNQDFFSLSDGTFANSIFVGFFTNILLARVVNAGSLVCNINVPLAANTKYKFAFAYKENDCKLYINGVDSGTDTSVTIPAVSQFGLNQIAQTSNYIVSKTALSKTRLSNAQLEALTS